MSTEFTSSYHGPGSYSVAIEADRRMCYAYFLDGEDILGDVWLFNRIEAPEQDEWKLPGAEPPFMNSRPNAIEYPKPDIIHDIDFRVEFRVEGSTPTAYIYLNDVLTGVVWKDSMPGKSVYAKRNSPVALCLESSSDQP